MEILLLVFIPVMANAVDAYQLIFKNGSIAIEPFDFADGTNDDEVRKSLAKHGFARRIFAGVRMEASDNMPCLASLLDEQRRLVCGATVVSTRYVLTAAHCLEAPPPKIVHFDSMFLEVGGLFSTIRHSVVHPKYLLQTRADNPKVVLRLQYDLALVESSLPLKHGDDSLAIRIADAPIPFGEKARVGGWGASEQISEVARTALFADVKIVRMPRKHFIRAGLGGVPLDDARPQFVCKGDSGGPLLYRGQLVGTVLLSGQMDCQPMVGKAIVSVFLEITQFKKWISTSIVLNSAQIQCTISRLLSVHLGYYLCNIIKI